MRWRWPAALDPRTSLRARFTLLIGGSGVALALLSAAIVDTSQRQELVSTQGQAMRRESLLLARTLESALQQRMQQLRDTASHPLLASGLVDPGETRLLLESLRTQQPALAWLAVLDPTGRVLVATNTLLEGADLHQERWFSEAMKGAWIGPRRPAGPLTSHLGLSQGEAPRLLDMGLPLIDLQGRRTGVLAARLRWDWLDDLHRSMQAPDRHLPGTESMVLDRDGQVLLGPAAWLDRPLAFDGLAALRNGSAPAVLPWPGEGLFVTALGREAGTEAGLTVLVRQPVALAFQAADALRARLLVAGLAGTVAFMLLSLWLAGRVARPIRSLSQAAMRVVHDQPPQFDELPARRADEVAELARSLRSLHDELTRRLHEQRQALAQLRESEAQLLQTSRMARVGGWSLDLASQEGRWTAELTAIFGLPADTRPTPQLALSFFEGEDQRRLKTAIRALLENGQPYDLELQALPHGGQRKWVRAMAQAVWHEGRMVRVEGVTQDITERRAAQEALHELNAQLEQRVAERTAELSAANAELDAFAYAVSHDLRAPLRAMSGFSQALIEDHGPALDPEARSYLDQIVEGSRRMGELIEGLLVLSRSVRGALRGDVVDLSRLAEQAVAELRRADPERQVEVEIEPGLQAFGDPRMLASVLGNLLGNAWKYTAGVAAPRITVRQQLIDGVRWYGVSDNGSGFDMAHAGRLFKAFARLHRQDEFPGLGIGLATVQRIIHRHGGRIEAESSPGAGATFRFTLPDRRAGLSTEGSPP